MINDRFKDKIKKLEQEREEFLSRLTPEDQQEYQQKKDGYSQVQIPHAGLSSEKATR